MLRWTGKYVCLAYYVPFQKHLGSVEQPEVDIFV